MRFDLEIFVSCFPQMATNPRACLHWQSRGVALGPETYRKALLKELNSLGLGQSPEGLLGAA